MALCSPVTVGAGPPPTSDGLQGVTVARFVSGLLLAAVIATQSVTPASAAEICRYSGTTSQDGKVTLTTDVTRTGEQSRVDVTMRFEATSLLWFHIQYLAEEISTWQGRDMQNVAVNTRYLLGKSIVRQGWDRFQRGPDGMIASRIQGKTLDDFRQHHPGFVQNWDPASFGQPWLRDYDAAASERRRDLDLPAPLPPGLQAPLAMAFYWVRFLPPTGQNFPVFLLGFKKDKLADVPVVPIPGNGDPHWRADLHYPALSQTADSFVTARTTPDRHLLQLDFALHTTIGSGEGVVHADGCRGR